LNGTIPDGIKALKELSILYLNGNSLTGLVPDLPFEQFMPHYPADNTSYCHLRDKTTPTNAFTCPLPPNSASCGDWAPTCNLCAGDNMTAECASWVQIFDMTGGNTSWTNCQASRLDPCSCTYSDAFGLPRGVTCAYDTSGYQHITKM
jgi:hypothetical protein